MNPENDQDMLSTEQYSTAQHSTGQARYEGVSSIQRLMPTIRS